jgi:PmbA protein
VELEKILDGLKGFDSIIIKKVKTKRLIVKFVLSEIAEVQRLNEVEYSVSVVKGKRFYSYTFSGEEELDKIITGVKEGFNYTVESDIVPQLTENDGEVKVKEDNAELRSVIEGQDVSFIDSVLAKSEFPSSGIVNVYELTTELMTNKGFKGTETRIRADGYARSFNGEYSGQWAFFSDSLKEFNETLKKANEFASITGKVRIDDGKYNVVLSPLVVANFMVFFADFASAFSVMTASSFLANYKKGEKVASELLTISDVPRKGRIAEFDDEATYTRDKEIIKEGVFNSLLFNNELAQIFGEKSTGNAGLIYPIAYSFEINSGEQSLDSLLASGKEVIFLNNNWYTRFQNYYEGTFSTVGRDAIVYYKEGKPQGVAGRIRISDSFPNLMKNVKGLGKDKYSVRWWDAPIPTISPYVYVDGVNITKAW